MFIVIIACSLSFLTDENIQLYEYATIDLCILQLMDIWMFSF